MSRILGREGRDEIYLVAGDRQPVFRSWIRKQDGTPFEFGPAEIVSARVRVRQNGSATYAVDTTQHTEVTLSGDGREVEVVYDWQDGDIVSAGVYNMEVEVLLTDATSFTSPTKKSITVVVRSKV